MTASVRKILNAKAAAAYLGMTAQTLRKIMKDGDGPPYCRLTARYTFFVDDLDKWVESKKGV
jgi:predicted DNA-binding transcriptional regulator AlpA